MFLEDTTISNWSMGTGYSFLGWKQQKTNTPYVTVCTTNFGCIFIFQAKKTVWTNPHISLQTFLKEKTSVMRAYLHIR